jgi:hypothetical protein
MPASLGQCDEYYSAQHYREMGRPSASEQAHPGLYEDWCRANAPGTTCRAFNQSDQMQLLRAGYQHVSGGFMLNAQAEPFCVPMQ